MVTLASGGWTICDQIIKKKKDEIKKGERQSKEESDLRMEQRVSRIEAASEETNKKLDDLKALFQQFLARTARSCILICLLDS